MNFVAQENDGIDSMTSAQIMEEGKRVIQGFLKNHTCYDLIPRSGKVIVFDVDIPVKLAFYALVEHGVASAPLLDPATNKFVGMFTATDFIEIIRYFYKRGSFTDALTDYSVHAWRSMQQDKKSNQVISGMISLPTTGTLYDACLKLRMYRIHRVPIMHPHQNSVLGIASHLDVLKYLVARFQEQRRLFDQCIFDLKIGRFQNVITATNETPLIDVLDALAENRISSVPILDSKDGTLVDIYCSNYVTYLGKDSLLNYLKRPVGKILEEARATKDFGDLEPVHTCNKMGSLHTIFQTFAIAKSHRLVCIDKNNRCDGIVTLSDLLNYFL